MRKIQYENDRCKGDSGRRLLIPVVVLMFVMVLLPVRVVAEGSKESKWAGVDEAVIEKIAKEHGRVAKEPLIGDDQGDILLFLFLLAGAAGGFVAGYYWRVLIAEKGRKKELSESLAGSPGGRIPAEKRE
jgi:ABC-type cobalt transport system substrate-binding protein